ncbi:hypothetical protein L1887_18104 [Cichorium endivia]|nr:hypothetical protein L1887_18104 [Cichorium endivia]
MKGFWRQVKKGYMPPVTYEVEKKRICHLSPMGLKAIMMEEVNSNVLFNQRLKFHLKVSNSPTLCVSTSQ